MFVGVIVFVGVGVFVTLPPQLLGPIKVTLTPDGAMYPFSHKQKLSVRPLFKLYCAHSSIIHST